MNNEILEEPDINSNLKQSQFSSKRNEFFTEVSSLQHHGKTIKVKGVKEGLTVRIDGQIEWREIIEEVRQFFSASQGFLKGGHVALEWVGKLPSKERCKELELMLRDEFEIIVISSPKKEAKLVLASEPLEVKEDQEIAVDTASYLNGLFEGENSLYNTQAVEWSSASEIIAKLEDNKDSNKKMPANGDYLDRVSSVLGDDCFYDDEANAKVIFGTLRSGQRIETPFSLIVVGDVNPGADIIAGGDIIILGNLRGTAHAAAYDDAEDRIIFALKMQPMQLRIGAIISRGSNECGKTPEIARVENKRIIVESFSPRGSTLKKR